MSRNSTDKNPFRPRLVLLGLALLLVLASPKEASAQCEQPANASVAVAMMQIADNLYFQLFIQQEASFMWNNVSNAFVLLSNAWDTFEDNVLQALNTFATTLDSKEMATGWRFMTRELHVAQVDQTYRRGQLLDAQLMAEEKMRADNYINEAQTRYAPSELACAIDTTGPGLNKAYQISRALNRTLAMDDQPRRQNATGDWPVISDNGDEWVSLSPTSRDGKGVEVNATYRQFNERYCDRTMGDLGCTGEPGPNAGRHKDMGYLLWGPKQTIDPSDLKNIQVVQDALRYVINPLASDPIPETVIPKPGVNVSQAAQGRTAILQRNAENAYINTIYNTLGGMLSERIGGSRVDVSLMRTAAGIPEGDTQPGRFGASYREIQEAMTRDRFDDPQYLIKMLGNPEQVQRERSTLGALRLQTMNDIHRRQEELLFMESAGYGRELNHQIPRAYTARKPLESQ